MHAYASKTFTSSTQSSIRDRETMTFLWKCALQYSKISPFLSRHLMFAATRKMIKFGEKALFEEASKYACNFCGSLWMLGKCSMKLASKNKIPKFCKKIQKLEKKNAKKLTKYQMRILELYANLTVTQVYKCGVCNRVSKIPLKICESKLAQSAVTFHGKVGVKHSEVQPLKPVLHGKKDITSSFGKPKKREKQKKGKHKDGKGKSLDTARERLLSQIREVKTDRKESQEPASANYRLVSTVRSILKSDAHRNKLNSGHQLLSFLNTL